MKVIVFGGRGFVGSAIVKIVKNKYQVITSDQNSGKKSHVKANILNLNDLNKVIDSNSIVINLVGLSPLREPKGVSYNDIHVKGVKNLVKVCENKNVKRLIHMSALGADKGSKNKYFKSKGIAEEIIKKSKLTYNIFSPSIIYDKDNELIKLLIKLAPLRFFPKIKAKLQPIYRGDIAKLFKLAIEGKIKERRIEIGGPEIFSFFEFAKIIFNSKGYTCIPMPLISLKAGMYVLKNLSLFGITNDQIRSLEIDTVTHSNSVKKYIKLTKFSNWFKKNKK